MKFKEMFTEEEEKVEILWWIEPSPSASKATQTNTKKLFKKYKPSEVYITKETVYVKGYFSKTEIKTLVKELEKDTDFTQSSNDGSGKISNYGAYIYSEDKEKWFQYHFGIMGMNTNLGGNRKQPGK